MSTNSAVIRSPLFFEVLWTNANVPKTEYDSAPFNFLDLNVFDWFILGVLKSSEQAQKMNENILFPFFS